MKLAAEAPLWLALIFALLLVAGAAEDAARLRISNLTCGLILIGAIVAMAVVGPELRVWQNFAVLGFLLAAGTPLFAAGKMGGGDVKLFAASGLWFDIQGGVLLLMSVLISGGVLALVILGLRMIGWSESILARVQVLRARAGIPYGVAIAAGAVIATATLRNG
ncbi:MAG TPA: prepilin peptidase [Sphingomicrobium sp.]|nr:prepilin peptidase [Sphingomicrobium sp.]